MTKEALPPEQWRRLALSAYLPTGLSFVGTAAVMPLIALSARALGASVGEAAGIVALVGVGNLLGALPAGWLAERFGEKHTLAGALLVETLTFVVAWRAPSLAVLAPAVLVVGIVGACLGLARQSYLTEVVPLAVRARALSTLGGVMRVGAVVGPLLGAAVVSYWNLSAAYLLAAATSAASMLVTLLLPDLPGDETRSPADTPVGAFGLHRTHARTYLTIGTGAAVLMLVRASRESLLPLWGDQQGFAPATISLIVAMGTGADMLLFYLGGSLMDRFGRAAVAVPSLVIMSTCFALLPLTSRELGMTLVAVGLGLGNGISSGVVMTIGSDASPELGRSAFLGGFRLTVGLGQAGGPLLISVIASVAPLASACLAVAGIGLAGSAWLWRWLPRPHATAR